EVSGHVVAVGAEVSDLAVGDRVVAATGIHAGGCAEYVAVPARGVARVPDGIDLVDAVALTEGGLTALPFLRDHGRSARGRACSSSGPPARSARPRSSSAPCSAPR